MKLGALLKWGVFNERDCCKKGDRGSFAARHFYNDEGKLKIAKIY